MPRSARTVLLYGGVFDPPHRAHVELSRRVRDRLLGRGAWLVYVPAAASPFKAEGPVASDADRVEMLRLATGRVARSGVWTDEIDRAGRGPSYWIETLRRAVRVAPPGAVLRFLIGSDQAAAFHRWREYREILALAEPMVMLRAPHRTAAAALREMRRSRAWTKAELEQWGAWIDDGVVIDASSTQVREGLAEGASGAGRGLIAAPVRAYIKARGLYGA